MSTPSFSPALREHPAADSTQQDEFLAVARRWSPPAGERPNALTCDVEDWFQVSAFEPLVPKETWRARECRIPRNVGRVIELCEDAGVHGTFFTLGWVAERHPDVVRRIADAGHEVASHGMRHVRVRDQSAAAFREDIAQAKKLLEDVSGQAVRGYRAASWSLDRSTPWAHRIMAEVGYEYSSSIYPIAHDHYGSPDAPTAPFYVKSAGILEIPASTARLLGRNLPASGGGYFRLLPYAVSRALIARIVTTTQLPAVFYFHPWELDPGQPRMRGISLKNRFRHYVNLRRFEPRLARLLKELPWGRMDEIYLRNAG
ncbi:MAG TPA: XrtA system polysaccharide deacetylase [Woeseiaceae bacterium]|nr:XrtA system polysaccharide deacetylase [Woeseiaceae bacterium]